MTAELDDPLLLQFAADRPEELAAVLTGESLEDVCGFISGLPHHSATVVVTRLPSWQLTPLLGVLEAELISRMLTTAATDDAVAIVSHLRESRYADIIDATPEEGRRALRQLFDYPSHSLAALASPGFVRVEADTQCGPFCEQLSSNSDTRPLPVLVVDGQSRYLGRVTLQALYARKNRARTVGEIATAVEPLSGLTSAESALSSRLWMRYTELPVVDGRHRVLGVVTRAALQRVAGETTPAEFNLERMFAELATGYLTTCSRLLESVLGKSR